MVPLPPVIVLSCLPSFPRIFHGLVTMAVTALFWGVLIPSVRVARPVLIAPIPTTQVSTTNGTTSASQITFLPSPFREPK